MRFLNGDETKVSNRRIFFNVRSNNLRPAFELFFSFVEHLQRKLFERRTQIVRTHKSKEIQQM